MTTLREIALAIETQLQAVPDLNAFSAPPAAPAFPCAFPVPPAVNYRETMRQGVITLQWEVVVMNGTSAGHEESQVSLYDFLEWSGQYSIFAALEADPTLGLGVKVNARVNAPSRPLGLDEIGGYDAFGAALPYLVVVTNT